MADRTPAPHTPVYVIGGGPGGLAAAAALGERGVRAVVLERNHAGGRGLARALRPAPVAHDPADVGAAHPTRLRPLGGARRPGAVPGAVRRTPPVGVRHRRRGRARGPHDGGRRRAAEPLGAARQRRARTHRAGGRRRHRLQPHPYLLPTRLAGPYGVRREVAARGRLPQREPVPRQGRPRRGRRQLGRRDRHRSRRGRCRPGQALGADRAARRAPVAPRLVGAAVGCGGPQVAGAGGGPGVGRPGPAVRARPRRARVAPPHVGRRRRALLARGRGPSRCGPPGWSARCGRVGSRSSPRSSPSRATSRCWWTAAASTRRWSSPPPATGPASTTSWATSTSSTPGATRVAAAPGLYFTGYANPASGMLRELATESRRIAQRIARDLR